VGHLVELCGGLGRTVLELVEIVLDFAADEGFSFFALVAMVDGFHAGFKAECDE
jgi:hypothetical protein